VNGANPLQIIVDWDLAVSKRFLQLAICIGAISNIHVEKENANVQKLRKAVCEEVRSKYDIEKLKDNPTVRAYRDFYWQLDIDPTKTRPSGEALLRRVLHGNDLPSISTVVDAYNLASMKTIIPISGFDQNRLNPPFQVRFAKNNEPFLGIGMSKPMMLSDKMLVLTDESQSVSIYPYRDLDYTKVTNQTKDALIIGYGAPGVTEEQLKNAVETTLAYINQVSGGRPETVKVFSPDP
jgi:DNA/RNA-binding domain of Phe-tRNA-synthetase-like protein